MPVKHMSGNIGCTPPSLKFRPDIQAGDLNMGVIITRKSQKAINLDEIICAVGVKKVGGGLVARAPRTRGLRRDILGGRRPLVISAG